jgi:hypothetical protein
MINDTTPINVFMACNAGYYHNWAVNCIKSIQHLCPWITIHILIVNPVYIEELPGVIYHYEYIDIPDVDTRIGYYQAVRFLRCSEIFPNNELVAIIDVDTILTKKIGYSDFFKICRSITVLKHPKDGRWLAGIISLGKGSKFRNKFKQYLEELPIHQWRYGWDQDALKRLTKEFEFNPLPEKWMSLGKNRGNYFLTLKGDKKEGRFKEIYDNALIEVLKHGNT